MKEEINKYNNKTELALSALMFFSPLIQNQIKRRSDLSQTEMVFVKGFIKIGYINIIMLLIAIGIQVFFYLTSILLLQTISLIITIILTIFLVIGSIYAISNKEIIKTKKDTEKIKKEDTLNVILSYLPIYNIYLRYKKHNFENPDLILKESILLWGLFVLLFLVFQNININSACIVIIFIRLITVLNNIDRPTNIKTGINSLFKKNPEEVRGYIIGLFESIFNHKKISENIQKRKSEYEFIFKIEYKQILLEYLILGILSIYLIYLSYNKNNLLLIIPIFLVLSRYIIMFLKRKRIPHLPIIKEITNLFFKQKSKKGE